MKKIWHKILSLALLPSQLTMKDQSNCPKQVRKLLAHLLVGQRRGKVKDQSGQKTKTGNRVEVSTEISGTGGDQVGVLCNVGGGNINDLNGDHLGRSGGSVGRRGDCV